MHDAEQAILEVVNGQEACLETQSFKKVLVRRKSDRLLARFVVDIVDQLDLSELVTRYGGGGKQPYHPAVLVALLFYGYATGIFSSRKLEQATHDSVAFRYITADAHPDHDTIATFRKRFLPELEGLFVQILVVAKVMGVFKLGKVSLDGTKIKANASKHKAMSWGYANKLEEQLRREVQELLRRAKQADTEDEPQIDIPDELARREDRLAAIKQAKEEIERRAQERFEAEQAAYEAKLKCRQDVARVEVGNVTTTTKAIRAETEAFIAPIEKYGWVEKPFTVSRTGIINRTPADSIDYPNPQIELC